MELPEIIKDRMDLEVNDQISVTLFPDDEGQPKCDVLKLNFTEIEGKKTSLYMTPCEAMEIASALNTAVQFYLYNQEQYREEILKKRMEAAEERNRESDNNDFIKELLGTKKIDADISDPTVKLLEAVFKDPENRIDCKKLHEKMELYGFTSCSHCGAELRKEL